MVDKIRLASEMLLLSLLAIMPPDRVGVIRRLNDSSVTAP